MSRLATKLAYGANVLGLGLKPSALALLRAICWKFDPRRGKTDPISGDELARLTGVRSPSTQDAARKRLRELGLLSFEHANMIPVKPGEKRESTVAYAYFVNLDRLGAIRPEDVRRKEKT